MTSAESSEQVTGPFKETPLTIREHMDPDKHWIGETLPAPTQTEIASTIGTVSGPGDSPFPARADHTHKLEVVRHRRNRNGLAFTTGSISIFGSSAVGSQDENVGGITFTTDATNGYFTVPTNGVYSLFLGVDPSAALGTTSALFISTSSKSMQFPVQGGTGMQVASAIVWLAASSTITFSLANNSGGGLTGTLIIVEITRLAL